MAIQQLEQLNQGQRQFGLTVLVAREGIDTAAEEVGSLPLVKIKFPAHPGDVIGIDIGGIHLALKQADQFAVAVAMLTVQDDFPVTGAEVAGHRCNGGGFTLLGVGHVARVVDQFRRAAAWTFHGYNSLKETINTSSMTDRRYCDQGARGFFSA